MLFQKEKLEFEIKTIKNGIFSYEERKCFLQGNIEDYIAGKKNEIDAIHQDDEDKKGGIDSDIEDKKVKVDGYLKKSDFDKFKEQWKSEKEKFGKLNLGNIQDVEKIQTEIDKLDKNLKANEIIDDRFLSILLLLSKLKTSAEDKETKNPEKDNKDNKKENSDSKKIGGELKSGFSDEEKAKIDEALGEIEKENADKGTILEQLLEALLTDKGDILGFVSNLFRNKDGMEAFKKMNPKLDGQDNPALIFNEAKLHLDSSSHFAGRIFYGMLKTQAQEKLYFNGFKKTEVKDNNIDSIDASGEETLEQSITRYLNDKMGEEKALVAIERRKKAGLLNNFKDKKLVAGTKIYLTKDSGHLLDVKEPNDESESINKEYFEYDQSIIDLLKNNNLEGNKKNLVDKKIDYMESNLKPGDIIMMRGNDAKGAVVRNSITMENKGDPFTHMFTYIGEGQVVNIAYNFRGGKALIHPIKEVLGDKNLSTGYYMTLRNKGNEKDATEDEKKKVGEFVQISIGKVNNVSYADGDAVDAYKNIGFMGKSTNEKTGKPYNICTGFIQNNMCEAGLKYLPVDRTLTPAELAKCFSVIDVGNVRER